MNLVNFIKYNRAAYNIYYYCMSGCINILKWFVRPDDKLILFNSFAGRKYDDSPRVIFEQMKKDPRFRDYRIVWAFHHPEQFEVDGAEKIRTNGFAYFRTALAARVWITNSSVERGLRFKGKKTFYFNTWHGTPIKRMGSDIGSGNESFGSKGENAIDIMMSQGRFDTDVFSRSFNIPRERFLEAGLPRNDILANHTEQQREEIREKLGIPEGKKVLLYCPTFREYEKDEHYGVVLAPPMDLQKWQRELKDWVLLFRAHYEVSRVMELEENEFLKNMTDYPCLNDLYIASDALLSDYSSVYFDYSITGKPMFHFTYDYDTYSAKRGMYFDIRDYLSGAAGEDEVISLIQGMDTETEKRKTADFRDQYVSFYGHAAEAALDCIAKEIMR